MPSARRLPALSHLQGVLSALGNRNRRPMSEILDAIDKMVRDAIDVLQEPDPLKQRIAFVLLALQQSTEIREVKGHMGRVVRRVRVVDQDLYTWAMQELHVIGGGAR